MLEDEVTADYTRVAIARIKETHSDGRIELDEHFVPPCLDLAVSPRLTFFLGETLSLLSHRAQAISSRLGGHGGHRGSSELADILLLQMVNRYQAQLRHLKQVAPVHPEELFQLCSHGALQAEMATFTRDDKLSTADVGYDHNNLSALFSIRLMGEVRQSLSLVFEQTAIALPLQMRRFGVWVAPIQDRALLEQAQFFLAVKATGAAGETIASRMPDRGQGCRRRASAAAGESAVAGDRTAAGTGGATAGALQRGIHVFPAGKDPGALGATEKFRRYRVSFFW
ncbi:MAG: type VI secretion system baseplate subunit TssK [Gammaproteobacteria bacterium]